MAAVHLPITVRYDSFLTLASLAVALAGTGIGLARWLARYATGFEARLHNIAGDGPAVFTQRTDVLERGRFRAEFCVRGTFEVRDGRIILWRDYCG